MNTVSMPPSELTWSAITILSRELGVVNTARFINQFSPGYGNYTEERDALFGDMTVDEIVAAIKQRRAGK